MQVIPGRPKLYSERVLGMSGRTLHLGDLQFPPSTEHHCTPLFLTITEKAYVYCLNIFVYSMHTSWWVVRANKALSAGVNIIRKKDLH